MGMNVECLDLEGVLVPEIWIAFVECSQFFEHVGDGERNPDGLRRSSF